jgi:hypothetical protein
VGAVVAAAVGSAAVVGAVVATATAVGIVVGVAGVPPQAASNGNIIKAIANQANFFENILFPPLDWSFAAPPHLNGCEQYNIDPSHKVSTQEQVRQGLWMLCASASPPFYARYRRYLLIIAIYTALSRGWFR